VCEHGCGGGGFGPPTFGLCDLTHLSMRVGLYLHPRGVLAIQSMAAQTLESPPDALPVIALTSKKSGSSTIA
jgi:hypothetical protein